MEKKHDWTVESYEEYRSRIVRESQQRRRWRARMQGLCPICAMRKPTGWQKTCEVCRDRIKAYQKARRMEHDS